MGDGLHCLHTNCLLLQLFHHVVQRALRICEASANGPGACYVARITPVLSACVHEQQLLWLQQLCVLHIVYNGGILAGSYNRRIGQVAGTAQAALEVN